MSLRTFLATTALAASLVSLPALAMDLNGAMNSLPKVKASGLLGEQPNGYLGVVSNQDNAGQIANLINQARKSEYQRLASDNKLQLSDVETMAGKKAIEKTPAGQYILVNDRWMKK
jgi:uncharacterized protein YdbL (DUF1318 family)